MLKVTLPQSAQTALHPQNQTLKQMPFQAGAGGRCAYIARISHIPPALRPRTNKPDAQALNCARAIHYLAGPALWEGRCLSLFLSCPGRC